MTLIGNRVLVKPDTLVKWHGIDIPMDITHFENQFMDMRVGTVVAVGVGRRTKKGVTVPIEHINVGDRVLLPRSDKIQMNMEDGFHWLCNSDSILGKLDAA